MDSLFDVVIDLDVVLCDLVDFLWMVVVYDFGDYFYLGDVGNWVMVEVVDLEILLGCKGLDFIFEGKGF